jgi:hypothetical protein
MKHETAYHHVARPQYLRSRAVAKMLGFDSTVTVLRLLQREELPFVVINSRTFLVEEAPLMQFLSQNRVVYTKVRKGRKPRVINAPITAFKQEASA